MNSGLLLQWLEAENVFSELLLEQEPLNEPEAAKAPTLTLPANYSPTSLELFQQRMRRYPVLNEKQERAAFSRIEWCVLEIVFTLLFLPVGRAQLRTVIRTSLSLDGGFQTDQRQVNRPRTKRMPNKRQKRRAADNPLSDIDRVLVTELKALNSSTEQAEILQALLQWIDRHDTDNVATVSKDIKLMIRKAYWPVRLLVGLAKALLTNQNTRSHFDVLLEQLVTPAGKSMQRLDPGIFAAEHQVLNFLHSEYLQQRDLLLKHNLRLVYHVAKRHTHRRTPLLDTIQEGVFGLIRAIEKYRLVTGYRFSTYAFHWIESKARLVNEQVHGLVRLPDSVFKELHKLHHCIDRAHHGEARVSVDRLAAEMQCTPVRVRELLSLSSRTFSLDQSRYGEDADLSLLGVLEDETADTSERIVAHEQRRLIKSMLELLPDREAFILLNRYGLFGTPPQTIESVARNANLSRERVRQLQEKALQTLREKLSNSELGTALKTMVLDEQAP